MAQLRFTSLVGISGLRKGKHQDMMIRLQLQQQRGTLGQQVGWQVSIAVSQVVLRGSRWRTS